MIAMHYSTEDIVLEKLELFLVIVENESWTNKCMIRCHKNPPLLRVKMCILTCGVKMMGVEYLKV